MNQKLIKALKDFLLDKKNDDLVGKPASDEDIAKAEKELGVTFCADYVEFIKHFGGAFIGVDIRAFSNAESIGNETVVDYTNGLRASHPEINDTYVISNDGGGNPIMINREGQVEILPDTKQVRCPTGSCLPFERKLFVTVNNKILACERISQEFELGSIIGLQVRINAKEIAEKYNTTRCALIIR